MNELTLRSPTRGPRVVIIGGGFTGLSAALRLLDRGYAVTVIERDTVLGGLASGFDIGGYVLERFYHHWFTNDNYIMDLIKRIGHEDQVLLRPTRTGMYYADSTFKMSSPLDVLKFKPLSILDRIRLGLLVVRARAIKDWQSLESLTAREWLERTSSKAVYKVVWEPLIKGKFGPYADMVSAVWFWKKIALRGTSRSADGREMLAYYRGGFAALAESLGTEIRNRGGDIRLGVEVTGLSTSGQQVRSVHTSQGEIDADAVIATPALPQIASLLSGHVPDAYVERLLRVNYLANVCLVLEMDRSLSSTYWLNVADLKFPFVGVIEHTNFEPPASYGGKHIIYLSRYLPRVDPMYTMDRDEMLEFAIPHLQRMFPQFDRSWIVGHHVWKTDYGQPIIEKHYSKIMPKHETPLSNLIISTMAQVYPEDRGTNYAVREGEKAADLVEAKLKQQVFDVPA